MRQEEKRQLEECNKVKDRKRKRDKYAEKVMFFPGSWHTLNGEVERVEIIQGLVSPQKKKEDEVDLKKKKEGVNIVIPFLPLADNSNLSADGDDSFISVDSAMPSPFSEVSRNSSLVLTICMNASSIVQGYNSLK